MEVVGARAVDSCLPGLRAAGSRCDNGIWRPVMSSATDVPSSELRYPVIVSTGPDGRFIAVPAGVPEVHAEGDTREEAVEQVRAKLAAWGGWLYWVPVAAPPPAAHPALRWAGHARDDPDFDVYLEEIRRAREEADRRECSDTSSTPTT